MDKVIVYLSLSREELLVQLAEECSEAAQAALKLRRAGSGENPTPVSEEDAFHKLIEELADVMLSASVLFGCEFEDNDSRNLCEEVSDEIADIAGEKLDRWRNRLLARPLAKTIEVKEDVPDDRFDALAAPWARKIRAAFPAAFVNMYNELILVPKANMYIMLNQVRDERDFKAAVLEDCSRNAFKGCSRKLQDEHLDGINKLLDSKFTRDDIELIYTYLGNGIQHDLCLRFVASGYDLEVLREYDKKQEAGSNGKT